MRSIEDRVFQLEVENKMINTRMTKLEDITERMNEIATNTSITANEIKHLRVDMQGQDKRIKKLEDRPNNMWDKVISAFIGAIIAGVVSFVFS